MDKKLVGCLLSDEEIGDLVEERCREKPKEWAIAVAYRASGLQVEKVATYIEAEVKAEKNRILKIVTEQGKVVAKEHGSSNVYLDMFEELIYEEVNK